MKPWSPNFLQLKLTKIIINEFNNKSKEINFFVIGKSNKHSCILKKLKSNEELRFP